MRIFIPNPELAERDSFSSPFHLCMSQQSTAAKPSLQGVRIKARKGAVKAQAKHEPAGTFFSVSLSFVFLTIL